MIFAYYCLLFIFVSYNYPATFGADAETVRAKKYVLVKHFQGEPKKTDIELQEEELPALKDGEYLCKAKFLSVDPYMRSMAKSYILGTTLLGIQVAEIVESKNKDFPVGKLVVGYLGWRDYTIVDPKAESDDLAPYILPDFGNLPASLGLGALGMPGNAAYFGFTEICQPKAGETVVVTGAAGAVGSMVGQIAKIKGCKVIGFAGTDSKCDWLKNTLGFDFAFNYKTVNPANALNESALNGVDCYFDNVGGEISSIIISKMNQFGRITACGSISSYNADPSDLPKATIVQPFFVSKTLKMEGFTVHGWNDRWMEGIEQNLKWIQEGKIKYAETVTDGFENMFEAFIGMLRGNNTGKAVVRA